MLPNVPRGQGGRAGRGGGVGGKAEASPPPTWSLALAYLSVITLAIQVSHGARWVGGEGQDGNMELP